MLINPQYSDLLKEPFGLFWPLPPDCATLLVGRIEDGRQAKRSAPRGTRFPGQPVFSALAT